MSLWPALVVLTQVTQRMHLKLDKDTNPLYPPMNAHARNTNRLQPNLIPPKSLVAIPSPMIPFLAMSMDKSGSLLPPTSTITSTLLHANPHHHSSPLLQAQLRHHTD